MTSFTTPRQIEYYRLTALRSGLKLLKVGITPHRGWTLTKALKWASEYTGRTYRRSEIDTAIADLTKKQEEYLK
jgi:hypothetical protein